MSSVDGDGGRPRPTVLVVDDGASNRELVRTLLEDVCEVEEAPDGQQALDRIDAGGIDLVLLDVMMPGISGYDVCRRVRERHASDLLPVLMITSLTDTKERVAGFEAGADDFISKPINTLELRLRVNALLRTRRLYVERAELSREMQQLHDLKDDLVALLVHDLRNPLAGLMANLYLLDTEALPEEARSALDSAHGACERLKVLIDDLLQVRLLEDEAYMIRLVPVAAGSIAEAAVTTMTPAARARGMSIVVEATEPATLAGDAPLLQRALENLLANAIRHGPEGSAVVLRVRTTAAEVVLTVEDRGPGIPPEQRPLLFSKYGSVQLRRGARRTGHGLGLYLVRLVLQAHAGRVEIDDTYVAGTRVLLAVPRAPRREPEVAGTTMGAPAA